MDIYADNILDHFRHPRNYGAPRDATNLPRTVVRSTSGAWAEHEERNVECGDIVKVWLKLSGGRSEKSERIERIGWTGTGCAISQASMSILSEEVMGKEVREVEKLGKDNVYALLGVPIGPRRFKCALMGLHAVKNALRKAKKLPLQSWVETVEPNKRG